MSARLIAHYLPQFHPVPENDAAWGAGFTEWSLVARSKPLFPGHQQPRLPADLGFYDLRVPETRIAQAELARSHGIEAFWSYPVLVDSFRSVVPCSGRRSPEGDGEAETKVRA